MCSLPVLMYILKQSSVKPRESSGRTSGMQEALTPVKYPGLVQCAVQNSHISPEDHLSACSVDTVGPDRVLQLAA